jgi:hypothetical protein
MLTAVIVSLIRRWAGRYPSGDTQQGGRRIVRVAGLSPSGTEVRGAELVQS